jgi:hypothetical protein
MKQLGLCLVALALTFCLQAQDSLHIKRTIKPIKIDGLLDDEGWQNAQMVSDFTQFFPSDTSKAEARTEVRMTYDDQFVYVGAKVYAYKGKGNYVTPSLRRDYRGEANDGFTITIDAFQDKTNAVLFGTNPFGVQREGLIVNGGTNRNDFDQAWDNKWFSEAKIYDGYWIAEMAIPFKTLRYKQGSKYWNIKFYRVSSEGPERSVWPKVPQQFLIISQAFSNRLVWDEPLKKPGTNLAIIPYALSNYSENRNNGFSTKAGANIGGDAKIAVGPALNLDLTFNPDFSQVEADQQVTNLDRFEIFFPERRQFFLENADLFGEFGGQGLRPFFSRRIGVARDTSTGQVVQNPIYMGARLSGKLDNNWRVGLLSMQTARDLEIGQASTNYTVGVLQRKLFARSNMGIIAINKQSISDRDLENFDYGHNRVIGLDYNLASKDNKWTGKFFHHRSFEPNGGRDNGVTSATLSYNKVNWDAIVIAQDVGADYNPEVGFARRRNYQRLASTVNWKYYPKKGPFQSHGPALDFDVLGNQQYGVTDWDANLMYRFRFRSTADLNIRLRREFVYLFSAFDPTNSGGVKLPEGAGFAYNLVLINFMSDARKKIYFNFNSRQGQYFNGTRNSLEGTINYRMQPYGIFGIDFSYNRLRLPQPYSSADFWLIGPRFDISFSKSLFWTTFIQYNNQIKNVNINSRLQWRYRPVSDLFLVYTDNYFSDTFVNKNRALVLKFTYWLNL